MILKDFLLLWQCYVYPTFPYVSAPSILPISSAEWGEDNLETFTTYTHRYVDGALRLQRTVEKSLALK